MIAEISADLPGDRPQCAAGMNALQQMEQKQ